MKKNWNRENTLLCEQLAMILQSGILLSDGIRAIGQEVKEAEYRQILMTMADQLDQQMSFSEALKDAKIFDDYMINMVDIGEKSGYLDNVMTQLAIYYRRIDETKEKIKEAISYPSILILMMLVVISILVVKVLPLFQQVLNNLGAQLSAFALALMSLGNGLAQYGFIVLIIIAVVVMIFFIKLKMGSKNRSMMSLLSSFVLTRRLGQDMAVAQFAYAMSLLLNSGYDTDESLAMIPKMLDDAKLNTKIEAMRQKMKEGNSFQQAMMESGIFKGIYNRILTIGFKAGKSEETMAKIAQEYEDEVDSSINRFLNVIEPTLVGVLSIIVGIILLSVMLPLMSIMSSLG